MGQPHSNIQGSFHMDRPKVLEIPMSVILTRIAQIDDQCFKYILNG